MFNYRYMMSDVDKVPKNDYKVFGCFVGGGGSSLGYKIAGFNHLGGIEYNKKIASLYKNNLNPKYLYVEDIRDFNKRDDLPKELYKLDILDGSPPCTTFSSAGLRSKAYGIKKKFSEGGKVQILDELVFVYAETILKLKPKVFLFENVKGFAMEYAKKHKKRVIDILNNEYSLNIYILNADTMGVPQARERFFIIGIRRDLKHNGFINLSFNERKIPFKEICDYSDTKQNITERTREAWENTKVGSGISYGAAKKVDLNKICYTLRNNIDTFHPLYPRYLNAKERILASTFPQDYKYNTKSEMIYITGMCVPPLMIAKIAEQIKMQVLDKLQGVESSKECLFDFDFSEAL